MSDSEKAAFEQRTHTAGAFDIRNVIGGLMAVYGVILTVTGLFTESTPEVAYADDYNSNLIAGIVLLVVGVGFVVWARLRPVVVPVQKDDTAGR
ncbi:hypothetical protein [Nocardioides sp. AX2bis]|uniref:hypothetical protein n=1 Tax=Nocardioides sp. AX2bis TaxID=2653157 RepID=UPI001357840D|nr:hypothetical protein [Nocardioides sp. AX2bis]